jgi:CubicO group peptidase (beta-lactamase class C family)
VIGNHEGILSTAAKGQINAAPDSPLISDHTVFDLASLTKVIATAPAVMKLLDDGLINLSDPLSRWFPEFAKADHGEITILHLLTHTSGLRDFNLSLNHSMGRAVRRAAAQNYRQWTGNRFDYQDINFILLGELVRRVSGQTLDAFSRRQIYGPLGLQETMFLPLRGPNADIAPTAGYGSGVVGDANARRLGSVAGHAGLFSSAYDLSRFARLMLGGGMIENKRILSERAIAEMTTPYLCNRGQVRRGLGWDIDSPFSSSKGSFFSEASFGHTGYSGSSIWIDPQHDRFVILLTRRVNYHDLRSFNQLRTDVSTIASTDFKIYGEIDPLWEMAKVRARLLQPEQIVIQGPPVSGREATQTRRPARPVRVAKRHKSYKTAHSSWKRRKQAKG